MGAEKEVVVSVRVNRKLKDMIDSAAEHSGLRREADWIAVEILAFTHGENHQPVRTLLAQKGARIAHSKQPRFGSIAAGFDDTNRY